LGVRSWQNQYADDRNKQNPQMIFEGTDHSQIKILACRVVKAGILSHTVNREKLHHNLAFNPSLGLIPHIKHLYATGLFG
jgi:hypothetical protein